MPRFSPIGFGAGRDVLQAPLSEDRLGQHGRGGGAVTGPTVGTSFGRNLTDQSGAPPFLVTCPLELEPLATG